jgi:hypothetical protein
MPKTTLNLPPPLVAVEAEADAAHADARDHDRRSASRRGMLPDIPWAELLRQEED